MDFFCIPVRISPQFTPPCVDYTTASRSLCEKECSPLLARWIGTSVLISGDEGLCIWHPARRVSTVLLEKRVCSVCLLGNEILVGGSDGQLWCVRLHEFIQPGVPVVIPFTSGHDQGVMAIKPYKEKCLTVSEDGTMKMWSLETFSSISSILAHPGYWVLDLDVCGDAIVTCSADKTVKTWEYNEMKHSWTCLKTLHGHTDTVWSTQLCHQGTTIISSSEDGTIRFWDFKLGECKHILACKDSVVCFHLEGNVLFEGLGNGTIEVWQLEPNVKLCYTLNAHPGNWVSSLSLNGNLLVTASYRGRLVRVWKWSDKQ